MDAEDLRTFLAIHRLGGFSAAAEALARSQPAISRRIALLEAELALPLFERMASGISLSSAGRTLLPHAERVLAALRDAESEMAVLRSATAGAVSLATVGSLASANLTPILKLFARDHPQVELAIRTATSAEVSDLVRRGEVTLGLRYLNDVSADLLCEHVASEALRVACAAEHPLASRRVRSLAMLSGERWFAFPNAYAQRESFADNVFAQFQACGVGSIRWTPVDSLTAQKRLVEAGLGLALLPETAIDEELHRGTLATIDVQGLRATNPVYVVVRRDAYVSPAANRLLALLRNESGLTKVSTRPDRSHRAPQRKR